MQADNRPRLTCGRERSTVASQRGAPAAASTARERSEHVEHVVSRSRAPAAAIGVRRVIVAAPRGYCAGVERAIKTVEQGLERWGAPLYVRRQIVHNDHVVRDLERAGAVFVADVADVPDHATVVFSAHGVAPSVEGAA